ncbi:hypothetical protein IW262DRAFT_1549353 [Armillaria fumosa]|nr:hypothetical protein IW262DRAFT_1549353 [Armillaria fumosa]
MTTPLALPVTSDDIHCIFTIPELVTAFIRVCHLIDLIWCEIGGPSAIFRLLAPVEGRPAGQDVLYDWNCSFKTFPMPSGWARFDLYRLRVRILDGTSTYTNYRSIMSDIAVLGRDSKVFLPNLIDFSWLYVQDDLWRDSVLFMHEGIETFTLMLELKDTAIQRPILPYFEHIAALMPRLQNFTLHLGSCRDAYKGHLKPALSWFLLKLQYHKVLKITPMLDLYDVISSTASLPNIETIDAHINKYMSRSLFFAFPFTSPVILSSKL